MNEKNEIYNPDIERIDEINENLRLIQRKDGLTFGTDSYLLSAFARPNPKGRAADLGCGTGIISLLCASRKKFSQIYSVELQEAFARLSERNAELNGLGDRIVVKNADIRQITFKDTDGEVDHILMNPPYMKDGSGRESKTDEMSIARREINGTIYDFCAAAGRLLKYGGLLSIVHRPERLIDATDAMRRSGIEPKRLVTVYPDSDSRPCLILIDGKRGGAPGVTMCRPLIIYKKNSREYTDDMRRIYDEFTFDHIFSFERSG